VVGANFSQCHYTSHRQLTADNGDLPFQQSKVDLRHHVHVETG
jgi:hypothetical protein